MTKKEVFTERQMLDRLNLRYGITYKNGAYVGRRYTRAEQVPTAPGRWGGHRSADFVAIDQWSAQHQELTDSERELQIGYTGRQSVHVFEVKVTRADLKHELEDLSKSEAWGMYAHYFWLVIPALKLAEGLVLPEHWGVLVNHGASLKVARAPRRRHAALMPIPVMAGLVRAVAKTEARLAILEHELKKEI